MGGYIPFPDVPAYPGVPQLTRPIQVAVASNTPLSIALGTVENLLIAALQQTPAWGIYDQDGNRLGVNSNDTSTGQGLTATLLSQLTGSNPPIESTLGVDFSRESRISTFPVEGGGFASYNKVQMPANPVVTLALQGDINARTAFLEAIDDACNSTDLYSIVTPEIVYVNYNVERYNVSRRAQRGATLLVVDIYLEEIRQVEASFATAQIVAPQDPASTSQESNGTTQPAAPAQSTLLGLANGAKSFFTSSPYFASFFGGGN